MTKTAHRLRSMSISSNRLPGGSVAHYSDEWYTPALLVQKLGIFDLDPCAGPMNHAVRNLRAVHGEDGLAFDWFGRVWLNPPFSNVHDWLTKMVSHNNGIALVNARPETQWFQKAAASAQAVFWPLRRIKFKRPEGKETNPPVGQALIAWGQPNVAALKSCGIPGILTLIQS